MGKTMTLKSKVASGLRVNMKNGLYPPGTFLSSIRDLCEEYKVSHVTIQAALGELEKEGLIERYQRRGIIVKPPAKNTHTTETLNAEKILFVRWDISPAYTEFLQGIQNFCNEIDLDLVVLDSQKSHTKFLSILQNLPEGVKGTILIPSETPEYEEAISELMERNIAVVCLDNKILKNIEYTTVSPDDYTSGFVATSHLLELSHDPVYFIGFDQQSFGAKQRFLGWTTAMVQYGFGNHEDYYRATPLSENDLVSCPIQKHWDVGYDIGMQIFNQKEDANSGYSIFSCNDHFARGIYRAAEEMKLAIGKDVRIVGVGDYPFASRMKPALSSVHYSRTMIGYQGAKSLYQLLRQGAKHYVHQLIPVKLIERESSLGV